MPIQGTKHNWTDGSPAPRFILGRKREVLPAPNLRAVDLDGESWFLAADACRPLDHQKVTRNIARHVGADDKRTVSVGLRGSAPILVNESGLYSLIMESKKAEAVPMDLMRASWRHQRAPVDPR